MIKTEKVMKDVEVKRIFCDKCGKEIHWHLPCYTARCKICKADLCDECIGDESDDGSDHRTVWCKTCHEVGIPYVKEIDRLYDEIGRQHELWKKEALKKVGIFKEHIHYQIKE